jgi:hypothetical protein
MANNHATKGAFGNRIIDLFRSRSLLPKSSKEKRKLTTDKQIWIIGALPMKKSKEKMNVVHADGKWVPGKNKYGKPCKIYMEVGRWINEIHNGRPEARYIKHETAIAW